VLLKFHVFKFFLLLTPHFILLMLGNIICMVLVFQNLLRLIFCPNRWAVLEMSMCYGEEQCNLLLLGCMFCGTHEVPAGVQRNSSLLFFVTLISFATCYWNWSIQVIRSCFWIVCIFKKQRFSIDIFLDSLYCHGGLTLLSL
jgi:hypothetical protein